VPSAILHLIGSEFLEQYATHTKFQQSPTIHGCVDDLINFSRPFYGAIIVVRVVLLSVLGRRAYQIWGGHRPIIGDLNARLKLLICCCIAKPECLKGDWIENGG